MHVCKYTKVYNCNYMYNIPSRFFVAVFLQTTRLTSEFLDTPSPCKKGDINQNSLKRTQDRDDNRKTGCLDNHPVEIGKSSRQASHSLLHCIPESRTLAQSARQRHRPARAHTHPPLYTPPCKHTIVMTSVCK